ncbi:hypothetical protein FRC06_005227 [Ceratobasidium sp. 370]|nr:hypothetical protein FRC06_005227 [Ceratobasidium sp. 370]
MVAYSVFAPPAITRAGGGTPTVLNLDFSNGWLAGPVLNDYDRLFKCREISRLRLFKESPNSVHHRFIVLHMKDGTIHRFDRRPDPAASNAAEVMQNSPVKTQDTCVANLGEESLRELEEQATCEIELLLDDGANDILSVFAACYGISRDDKTKHYTLLKHNCFFFAWTILMVVARQHLPHRIPSRDLLVKRYLDGVKPVIAEQVDRDITHGTEAFLEAIIIFRERNRVSIRPEVDGLVWKLLLSIPTGVVKVIGRGLLKFKTYLGTRQRIQKAMLDNIQLKADGMWQKGLDHNSDEKPLDAHLWLDKMDELLLPVVKRELKRVLWEHIAEIFEAACESKETRDMVEELINRKKPVLWSRKAWEFRAVCIASFYAAISAVHATLKEQPYNGFETHENVFNRLWDSANKAALEAAKAAVVKSREKVRDGNKWDQSWAPVWDDWDNAWAEALPPVRTRIVKHMVEVSVDKYSQYGAELLLEEIRQDKGKVLRARFMPSTARRLKRSGGTEVTLTNGQLQQFIRQTMEDVRVPGYDHKVVQSSMAEMWIQAQGHLERREIWDPAKPETADGTPNERLSVPVAAN